MTRLWRRGPPSTGYRLRKFVRRNQGPVRAGVALAALLVLGIVGTSIGLAWALEAERAAIAAAAAEAHQRQDAETQRDRAKAAEKLANERLLEVTREKQRARAAETQAKEEAAITKAVNDFLRKDLLAQASPTKNARNKQVTVEELLGRAAARIAGKFEKQPRIEAAIRQSIGDAYLSLGNYAAAQPQLERALEIRRMVLGDEHAETLYSMSNLAELYRVQGRYAKAEPLNVKDLELSRRILGEKHPDTLTSMNNLAALYVHQGQLAKAEPLFIKALEGLRRAEGEDHPHTLTTMDNLANLYVDQGQYAKAEPLHREALEKCRKSRGKTSPQAGRFLAALGQNLLKQRKYDQAEPLLRESLAIDEEKAPERWTTWKTKALLGASLLAQKKYAEAEPLLLGGYNGMLARADKIPPPYKVRLTDALGCLVELYTQWEKPDEAAKWQNQLRASQPKQLSSADSQPKTTQP
jgi:tetratricopeptide (TPR) repeat protein